MNTPMTFQLNFFGLSALNAELVKWENIAKTLTGSDLSNANAYIAAVRAERDQRAASYSSGYINTAVAGFKGFWESLGGNAGAGASGLTGNVADAAIDTGRAIGGSIKIYIAVGIIAVVVIVSAVLYFKFFRK